jgi:hypothetical protein
MFVEVITIAVPEFRAPDPHALAGLIAAGFELERIEPAAGGHVLRFARPRDPPPRPIRTGWAHRQKR